MITTKRLNFFRHERRLFVISLLAIGLTGCPNLDTVKSDAGTADSSVAGVEDGASADTPPVENDTAEKGNGSDGQSSVKDIGGVRTPGDVGDEEVPASPLTRVRIVAANLSSGKKQSWDPGHGQRILQGLVPDIVLMQEFNKGDNSPTTIKKFVKDMCGDGFSFYRESGSAIPNGIISRYPIIASGSWDDALSKNREFAWARIDVPGPTDLWAISLHLLTSKSSVRAKQVTQLVAYIKQNVPEDDFLVVGGDLNTTSFSEQSLNGFNGLLDRTRRPVDQAGNGHTNSPRNKPYDRLFADFDLEPHGVPVKLGAQEFKNGLVFDSRVFTPLIDVTPAMKEDSGAEAMQHMAIVRDFALPTP